MRWKGAQGQQAHVKMLEQCGGMQNLTSGAVGWATICMCVHAHV
jgi:hypothetical protein